MPNLIRVSVGTAIVLGIADGKLDAEPTTAYLMTYSKGKCTANCGFCPQARASKGSADRLARVTWPLFSTLEVFSALEKVSKTSKVKRICIQALNYPQVFNDLSIIVKEIKKRVNIPLSVACQPREKTDIELLAKAGVDRLGIALDAATQETFEKVKGKQAGGPYDWEMQFCLLRNAQTVFGKENVSTHIIVGLGETERDLVKLIQKLVDAEILPALFAFTPVRGTILEARSPPAVESFRRVQLARYLIVEGIGRAEGMVFSKEGKVISFGLPKQVLMDAVDSGEPFRTSGCPDCNRPFYNEKPGGPIYNYPRKLSSSELEEARRQLKLA